MGVPRYPGLVFLPPSKKGKYRGNVNESIYNGGQLSNKHDTCGELPGKGIHGHAILTRNDQGIP